MLASDYEYNYDGLAAYLESHFAGYLTPTGTSTPPLGQAAEIYQSFPHIFSGLWPVIGVSELGPEPGKPKFTDVAIGIAGVKIGVRVYYPSLTRPDLGADYVDGREAAKRITRSVWSAWFSQFNHDLTLQTQGAVATIANVEQGDHDKLGNPFYQPATKLNTVLWVHATVVNVNL